MNRLHEQPVHDATPGSGFPLALYCLGVLQEDRQVTTVTQKRMIFPRQRVRNELLASLPPELGARLVPSGNSFHLELETYEKTIAHTCSRRKSRFRPARASKLVRED